MSPPPRPRSFSLATGMRLLVVASWGLLLWVFDWNWFRLPLMWELSERSGRLVHFDDLHLGLALTLEPTLRVRGLRVQNAPWADPERPLITAAEGAFTLSLSSVTQRRPVLSMMALSHAHLDLQSRADGLRNWRLVRPNDREPTRVTVQTVQASDSSWRYRHQALGLDVQASSTELVPPEHLTDHPTPLTQRWVISVTTAQHSLQGEFKTAAQLSLLGTSQPFPLQGQWRSGATTLELVGLMGDVFEPSGVDVSMRLSGTTLSELGPWLSMNLPASKPYTVHMQWHKDQALTDFNFSALQATVGGSTLSGTGDLDLSAGRPLLNAKLSSDALHPLDFMPDGVAWAFAPISGPACQQLDVRLELKARALHLADWPVMHNLRVAAQLEEGQLDIHSLHASLAGGQITGRLSLNTRQADTAIETALSLRQLRVEKLFHRSTSTPPLTGYLSAQVKLKGQGASFAQAAGRAQGSAWGTLEAGSLPSAWETLLAVDPSNLLLNPNSSHRPVPLRCGVLSLAIEDGLGRTQQAWLETDQTHSLGLGQLHLGDGRFELLLAPYRYSRSTSSTGPKSLQLQGSLIPGQVQHSLGGAVPLGPTGCKVIKAS